MVDFVKGARSGYAGVPSSPAAEPRKAAAEPQQDDNMDVSQTHVEPNEQKVRFGLQFGGGVAPNMFDPKRAAVMFSGGLSLDWNLLSFEASFLTRWVPPSGETTIVVQNGTRVFAPTSHEVQLGATGRLMVRLPASLSLGVEAGYYRTLGTTETLYKQGVPLGLALRYTFWKPNWCDLFAQTGPRLVLVDNEPQFSWPISIGMKFRL